MGMELPPGRGRSGTPWVVGGIAVVVAVVLAAGAVVIHGRQSSKTGSGPSPTSTADPTTGTGVASGQETAARAALLPLTSLPAAAPPVCGGPAALGGRQLPGASGRVRCLSTVTLDLDGDGRPDRLLLWTTSTARGAVAYLADGTAHPLVDGTMHEAGQNVPWTTVNDPANDVNVPLRTVQLGDAKRQQLLVGDYPGAHGYAEVMLGLSTDGSLSLVDDGHGAAASLVQADDYGCATANSGTALVVTLSGRGSAGQQDANVPGWGVSHLFYDLDGTTLTFLGYQGNVLPKAPASDTFVNDCSAPTPALPGLLPVASSARAAAVTMAEAVAKSYRPEAETVSAGGLADFSGQSSASPDAWSFLSDDVKRSLIPTSALAKPTFTCSVGSNNVTMNCLDYLPDRSGVVLLDVNPVAALTAATSDEASFWVVVGADLLDYPE